MPLLRCVSCSMCSCSNMCIQLHTSSPVWLCACCCNAMLLRCCHCIVSFDNFATLQWINACCTYHGCGPDWAAQPGDRQHAQTTRMLLLLPQLLPLHSQLWQLRMRFICVTACCMQLQRVPSRFSNAAMDQWQTAGSLLLFYTPRSAQS